MLGLPKLTEFNKRIPKQKFYENLSVTPAIKKAFTEQIKAIYWRNKLASTTLNVAPGQTVTEIEVFELKLVSPNLDENVLRLIDREIPYHILFVLEYQGKYQAWIGYKEATASGKVFKVNGYYHTEWLAEDGLTLKLEGLSIDAVYETLVRQIAGDKLKTVTAGESLKESVERDELKQALQKRIMILQTKIHKEKQINIQVQLNTELRKLKKELEVL